MPIFKANEFNQISISFTNDFVSKSKGTKFPKTLPMNALNEISDVINENDVNFTISKKKWSLYLSKIGLYESFEGIMNIFNPKNEIYFTSIAWDYSGKQPHIYPFQGIKGEQFIIPMHANKERKLLPKLGDGVTLWPSQEVVGSLNLVILIYESDSSERKLGEIISSVNETIKKSSFIDLLTTLSNPTQLQTSNFVSQSVIDLIDIIGNVFKNNGDDYVDLFEGSWGVEKRNTSEKKKYEHEAAAIELDLTISE